MAVYSIDWSDTNLGGSAVVSYVRGSLLDFTDKPAGATAALSITAGHSHGVSTTIAEFSVVTTGSSVMTFDYKVSTEAGWDKLHIDVDGVSQANYSGEVAWTTHSGINIPSAGTHTIRFRYERDGGGTGGSDRIWIALLNITNTTTVNDDTGGTVDTYDMEDGNIPSFVTTSSWINSTSEPITGSRSLRSPTSPAHSGSYDLTIAKGVNARYRVLAFDWKVSTEFGWDKLIIFPDATAGNVPPSGAPSTFGTPGWLDYSGSASGHISLILPPEASTILVRYTKDGGGQAGSDAVWVDNIKMPVATVTAGHILTEDDLDVLFEDNSIMVTEDYVESGTINASPSAIASAEAHGNQSATGLLTSSPTGFSDSSAFGSPSVTTPVLLSPSAIATALAFGSFSATGLLTASPSSIASAVALGSPVLSSLLVSTPTAIASSEAMGNPTVSLLTASVPSGIASALAFGTTSVSTLLSVIAGSLASQEAHGSPVVTIIPPGIFAVASGIASQETHGLTSLSAQLNSAFAGVGSSEAWGNPNISTLLTSSFLGIASGFVAGNPTLSGLLSVAFSGIASAAAMGTPSVSSLSYSVPFGIGSSEAVGNVVLTTQVLVSPSGLPSALAFGVTTINTLVSLQFSGISSGQAMGNPTIVLGGVTLSPSSINSLLSFGNPSLLSLITLSPSGVPSGEALGSIRAYGNAIMMNPSSIASAESFGSPTIESVISLILEGIDTAEAWGFPTLVIDLSSIVDLVFTARLSPRRVRATIAPVSGEGTIIAEQIQASLAPRNIRVTIAPPIRTQEEA